MIIDYIPLLNKLKKEKKCEEKFLYIEDYKKIKENYQEKEEESEKITIIDIL